MYSRYLWASGAACPQGAGRPTQSAGAGRPTFVPTQSAVGRSSRWFKTGPPQKLGGSRPALRRQTDKSGGERGVSPGGQPSLGPT